MKTFSEESAKVLKEIGGTHGGGLTVGQLRDFLTGLPDAMPIIGEVHEDGEAGWILDVQDCELSGASLLGPMAESDLSDDDDGSPNIGSVCLSLSRFEDTHIEED
jgi:hypothetical protein